jgi:hypothetical protein
MGGVIEKAPKENSADLEKFVRRFFRENKRGIIRVASDASSPARWFGRQKDIISYLRGE